MGPRNIASEATPDAAHHGLFLRRWSADLQYGDGRYADCEPVQGVGWDERGLVLFICIYARLRRWQSGGDLPFEMFDWCWLTGAGYLRNLTDRIFIGFSSVRPVCAIVLLGPSRAIYLVDPEDHLYTMQYVGTWGGHVEVQSDGAVTDRNW
jgi:hypothetical protein